MFRPIKKVKKLMILLSGFFIGASVFVMTYAYTVEVDVDNAVQYIKKIVIQNTDGSTGIILNTDNAGSADFNGNVGALAFCDENGDYCKDMVDILTGYSGLFSGGEIGKYCTYDGSKISCTSEGGTTSTFDPADYYNTGVSDSRYLLSSVYDPIEAGTDGLICKQIGGNIECNTSSAAGVDNNFYVKSGTYDSGTNQITLYMSGTSDKVITLTGINNGGTSLWTGNSDIYYNGGNVGIGTDIPTTKLHVDGTTKLSGDVILMKNTLMYGQLAIGGIDVDDPSFFVRHDSILSGDVEVRGNILLSGDVNINEGLFHEGDENTNIKFGDSKISFFAGGGLNETILGYSNIFNYNLENINTTIRGSGDSNLFVAKAYNDRIGIGTANPRTKLDVNGTGTFGGDIQLGRGTDRTLYVADAIHGSIGNNLNIKSARGGDGHEKNLPDNVHGQKGGAINISAGNGGNAYDSTSNADGGSGGTIFINPGLGGDKVNGGTTGVNGNIILANVGGNVGIGTNTPTTKLHVNGEIKLNGSYIVNSCANSADEGKIRFTKECVGSSRKQMFQGCLLSGETMTWVSLGEGGLYSDAGCAITGGGNTGKN